MTVHEVPSLEEEYGWMYDDDDDPPHITEDDIHPEDEVAQDDESVESQRDEARCLRGCPHFGRCDHF